MTLSNILIVSAIIFVIGLLGTISKKSTVLVIMSLELMFNAAALSFVAFYRFAHGVLLGVDSASSQFETSIADCWSLHTRIISHPAAKAHFALSIGLGIARAAVIDKSSENTIPLKFNSPRNLSLIQTAEKPAEESSTAV